MVEALSQIERDVERDAAAFDGKPFRMMRQWIEEDLADLTYRVGRLETYHLVEE